MEIVQVTGVVREPGGLKKALREFHDHTKHVGDALMNLVDGIDENDPRPAYVKQEFPRMVYHSEHGELTVSNEAELQEAYRQKYRAEPYPKPQIVINDPKIEKAEMERKNRELQGQVTSQQDILQKMQAQLEALTAAQEAKAKK